MDILQRYKVPRAANVSFFFIVKEKKSYIIRLPRNKATCTALLVGSWSILENTAWFIRSLQTFEDFFFNLVLWRKQNFFSPRHSTRKQLDNRRAGGAKWIFFLVAGTGAKTTIFLLGERASGTIKRRARSCNGLFRAHIIGDRCIVPKWQSATTTLGPVFGQITR